MSDIAVPIDGCTIAAPRWVGHWEIGGPGGVCVYQERRPLWLHRLMNRLMFGFVWKD